jgi:lysyl-tRNA synthetase class 2
MVNPGVREVFSKRTAIVNFIRGFLNEREYTEVETPMLQPIPGGAAAKPFTTHHNALGMDLYLRIAPELYLKRLIVAGMERVFEINRNFRNEGISTMHNRVFTMVEFYMAYADYHDMMVFTEELFRHVVERTVGSPQVTYQSTDIDFARPFQRKKFEECLLDIDGLGNEHLTDRVQALEFATRRDVPVDSRDPLGKIHQKIFEKFVEADLTGPVFVYDYPIDVSPLSRRSDDDPDVAERFELFIAGIEVANGFSELNDPRDQEDRFKQQVDERKAGDEEAHMMDWDYIRALEYGLPPTAGEGIGIDRLTMLLTDSASIRDVILFPHQRKE